jgi:hypothetical protein
MTYRNVEIQSSSLINSQLADILSGFKEVLKKCGAGDSTMIEFTLVDQKLEKEEAIVLPQGCKHKCWYSKAANSIQCGIVCSV